MSEPYALEFDTEATAELADLPKEIARRIRDKIDRLAQNADILPHESMVGQWKGYQRIKVGDYRVIYAFDKEIRLITIKKIGHRRDVYD